VFSGSSGTLAGQATFSIVGSSLQVQLTNTSSSDVLVPADVLTAVFFDISLGAPTLTPSQAILDPGSSVFYDSDGQPAGGIVGGEWAYKAGIAAAPPGGAPTALAPRAWAFSAGATAFPAPTWPRRRVPMALNTVSFPPATM
jgi:hypothetical protein